MNHIKYLLVLIAVICFGTSCDSVMDVDNPDFEVQVRTNHYKVGEVVEFEFSGQSDLISFYPGIEGYEYQYREQGKTFSLDSLKLEITTSVSKNNQNSEFNILFSTSFDGNCVKDNIKPEDWTDITHDGFILGTSSTDYVSPVVSIDDYFQEKKPFYLGFRYRNEPILNDSRAVVWRLRDLKVKGLTADGWKTVSELSPNSKFSAGFSLIDFAEGTPVQGSSMVYTDYIRFESATGPTDAGNEIWAISKAIDPQTLRLMPDLSMPVKAVGGAMPTSFSYIFNEAGTYDVYFVGWNITSEKKKEVVRKVTVTITDN